MYLYPYSILWKKQPKGDPKLGANQSIILFYCVHTRGQAPGWRAKGLDWSWSHFSWLYKAPTATLPRHSYRQGKIQRAMAQPSGDPESQKNLFWRCVSIKQGPNSFSIHTSFCWAPFIHYMIYFHYSFFFLYQMETTLSAISLCLPAAVNLYGLAQYRAYRRSSVNIYLIYLHIYLFTCLPIDKRSHRHKPSYIGIDQHIFTF